MSAIPGLHDPAAADSEDSQILNTDSHYKAFISYSHADDRLAPALQRGLETLGEPWYRRSALKIFRDETSLAANPGLWSSIEQNLARSAFFVLVASTEATRSPWVEREVAWWRAHRSMERILIAVANGAIVWDAQSGDFDWTRTTCLPAALARAFAEEPLYADLRWVEPGERLSLRNPRFRAAILTLAAPVHGKSKDELDSEAIRQQRRLVISAAVAAAAVLAFALAAGYGLHNAQQQAALTQQQTAERSAVRKQSPGPEGPAKCDVQCRRRLGAPLPGMAVLICAPTLDIDVPQIVTEKREVHHTYEGEPKDQRDSTPPHWVGLNQSRH